MSQSGGLLDDCFYHDRNRLKHGEALGILRQRISCVCEGEQVELGRMNGRILSADVFASHDIPLMSNAAVDGFGFNHGELALSNGRLPVSAKIVAGDSPIGEFKTGSAVRIFTGAVVPKGVDTVAMQEDCQVVEENGKTFVSIPRELKLGANLRKSGEDVQRNGLICGAGQRIRPQELAALASAGIREAPVYRKLRIATVSTGNELVRPGNILKPGQVFDSNTYLLSALLQFLPVDFTDLGILKDNRDSVAEALKAASSEYDAILTSGGASLGEEDHLNAAVDRLGTRHMWQLAVKPGRPMSFGQIGNCAVLALPGNPVAVMVCFLLYVHPTLLRMAGSQWHTPVRFPVNSAFELKNKKPDRREFLRGVLHRDPSGGLSVDKFERDGSGLITGLREADGLVEIDESTTFLNPGDTVSFIPFTEFGLPPRTLENPAMVTNAS